MSESILLSYRRVFIVLVHVALWSFAYVTAFLLRFDFSLPDVLFPRIYVWGGALLTVRVLSAAVFGNFQGLWRYTGAKDLVALFKSTALGSTLFLLFVVFTSAKGFPRSIFVIEFGTTIFMVGGLRFGIRKLREVSAEIASRASEKRRLLIVGAGDAAEMLVREVQKSHTSRYQPVGFVDDDVRKKGSRIHNLPVFGKIGLVPELVKRHDVHEVVVAIPTATGTQMRRILAVCKQAKVDVRTIPGINSLIDGTVRVNQIRDVAIEDLLGRDPVALESDVISESVHGAVVLVSGAGGSIGSELCRQVARFGPRRLILVERAENNLFEIHRQLVGQFPELDVVPAIADVADQARMQGLFEEHRPRVVFHAAAHKHVPMMEWNPGEAVKNNIRGSKVLADMADRFSVERFVMVSTDKAVNPTSVMGASKRVAEIYIQTLSARSETKFVTVRFGNVLGSAGSVIPIFKEQIKTGGPVTVTHPDMTRYFMTIPEACQLILQAGSMGDGGEIFVLDMGQPVKIVDLARDLITLSGFVPDEDIEIKFTGVRPGEKLFEELARDEENAEKTKHPKIFVGQKRTYEWAWVQAQVASLTEQADDATPAELRRGIKTIVPEFDSGGTGGASQKNAPAPRQKRDTAEIIALRG